MRCTFELKINSGKQKKNAKTNSSMLRTKTTNKTMRSFALTDSTNWDKFNLIKSNRGNIFSREWMRCENSALWSLCGTRNNIDCWRSDVYGAARTHATEHRVRMCVRVCVTWVYRWLDARQERWTHTHTRTRRLLRKTGENEERKKTNDPKNA